MAVQSASRVIEEDGVEPGWALSQHGFDPQTERGVEGAFSVANGGFGVRASLEEGSPASNPMLIVAGVYVPTPSPAGQTLLTLPDPALMSIELDGERLAIGAVETLSHRRTLDLRRAEASRHWRFRDAHGRAWRLESWRLASASDGCYLHRLVLVLEDAGRRAEVVVRADGVVAPPAAPVRAMQLRAVEEREGARLTVQRLVHGDVVATDGSRLTVAVSDAAPLRIDTLAAVNRGDQPDRDAAALDALRLRHHRAWARRWKTAAVAVRGDDRLQAALRFAVYHLLSAGAVDGGRTSIAARNLTGEAYHGHVFWDTEIFALPALTFTWPAAARSCLQYRHRTLGAARERARSLGYAGALHAWESTDTGEERTPSYAAMPDGTTLRVLNGEQEHHIAAAVPYAVLAYWRATGDEPFMRQYGTELLIESARFWCSRVSPADGVYSIRRVIGPDEYHTGVDNDAYTNAMARWVLEEAARCAGEAAARSGGKRPFGASPHEVEEWRNVSAAIRRSSFTDDEVVEQFDGFFSLASADVAAYRRAGVPIDIAVGFDAVQRLRVTKQADVLMTAALLPQRWTATSLRRNIDYYEPLTAHTSSLSPSIHALLAAWLRDEPRFRAFLDATIDIDLGGGYRNAAGGVHMAALGGLWQAVVFGLAGFKSAEDGIGLDPWLPDGIAGLDVPLQWQGRRVHVHVRSDRTVSVDVEGAPCAVRVNRERALVRGSRTFGFDPRLTYWDCVRDEEATP